MKKVDEIVQNIADLAIDSLFGFDDYDIDGDDCSIRTFFDFQSCNVDCTYRHYGRKHDIEILLNPDNDRHSLELLEDAVNKKVEEKLDCDELLDVILDKARDDSMDEWQSHGFRDEADYYHWRYG